MNWYDMGMFKTWYVDPAGKNSHDLANNCDPKWDGFVLQQGMAAAAPAATSMMGPWLKWVTSSNTSPIKWFTGGP